MNYDGCKIVWNEKKNNSKKLDLNINLFLSYTTEKMAK